MLRDIRDLPGTTRYGSFFIPSFIPQSALHYVECRAALNPMWFRAHSELRI
jgi:hypothetical protein